MYDVLVRRLSASGSRLPVNAFLAIWDGCFPILLHTPAADASGPTQGAHQQVQHFSKPSAQRIWYCPSHRPAPLPDEEHMLRLVILSILTGHTRLAGLLFSTY